MYCAGCGQILTNEQSACSGCGRPVQTAGDATQVYEFARTIRRLSLYWLLFAGLNVALGVTGLIMAGAGLSQHAGPWEPWPHPPLLGWTYLGAAAWALLLTRAVMALAAGMALRDHAECARPVAITAAAVAMTQFPIGLVLGAFTLAKLAGSRSATLFHRLT